MTFAKRTGILLGLWMAALVFMSPLPLRAAETKEETAAEKPVQRIEASSYAKTKGAKSFSLDAKVTGPEGAALGKLTYKSRNKKVAVVDARGKVTVKKVGQARIVITAAATKDCAKVSETITVTVNPKGTSIVQIRAIASKRLLVQFKKVSGVSGYEVRYSTSKKMKKPVIQRAEGAGYINKSLTGLKSGKKYYIQVRTYKTVKGMDYFSKWSKKASAKPMTRRKGY